MQINILGLHFKIVSNGMLLSAGIVADKFLFELRLHYNFCKLLFVLRSYEDEVC